MNRLFEDAHVPLKKLLLDPNNYRFQDDPDFLEIAESRFAEDRVQKKAEQRLRDTSLEDLKKSILTNGFLSVERIVARKHKEYPDLFVVLEGNRRVAALRWIEEDYRSGVDVPQDLLETVENIPILVLSSDKVDTGVYESVMGIRHVSGIKQWGGYQRSRLITKLKDDVQLELSEIAEKLGMKTREVTRRYRAFKALQQMENNDDFGDHADARLYPLFHEAISSQAIKEWLDWNESDYRFNNENELEVFYELISPRIEEDSEGDKELAAKIRSHRDVRELPAIVRNDEALSILKDPVTSFSEAVAIAKREEMAKAWKRQVSACVNALKTISVPELSNMNPDDLAKLRELKSAVESTLSYHEKLK